MVKCLCVVNVKMFDQDENMLSERVCDYENNNFRKRERVVAMRTKIYFIMKSKSLNMADAPLKHVTFQRSGMVLI